MNVGMQRFVRTAALLGTVGLAALPGCGSSSKGGGERSTTSAPQPAASSQALARALLTPANLSSLGVGRFKDTERRTGTGSGAALRAGIPPDFTFVSGAPACRQVLEPYPEQSQVWAFVSMQASPVFVEEEIQSFKDVAAAKRIMQRVRDQLANCHTFVGVKDHIRTTFAHRAISVPPMGEERVAHQLDGEATTASMIYTLTYNSVAIRSGSNMIFVAISFPHGSGIAETATIASAAVNKERG